MRELKFREVIRLTDGGVEFHYWGFVDHKGQKSTDCFVGPISPLNHSDQFTGLLDKNGKPIFE